MERRGLQLQAPARLRGLARAQHQLRQERQPQRQHPLNNHFTPSRILPSLIISVLPLFPYPDDPNLIVTISQISPQQQQQQNCRSIIKASHNKRYFYFKRKNSLTKFNF